MDIHTKTTLNDPIIEGQVIKKMLISKKVIPDIKPEFFTFNRKPLVEAILEQFAKHGTLDRVMLSNEHCEAYEFVISLESNASPVVVDELYKMWMVRECSSTVCNLNITKENVEKEISDCQLKLSDILHKNDRSKYDHYEESKKIIDYVQKGAVSGSELLGYSTGVKSLDFICNGLEKGKAYALGALKKCGKSRFAVYLSCLLAKQKVKVYWNSLEMTREQLNLLALSYYSGINSSMLGKSLLKRDLPNISFGMNNFYELGWNIYKDHHVYDMKSRILSLKEKPDIVFIDFIQKMQSNKYSNDRTREIENIAQDISDMTKDLGICTITLSQLQGAAEKLDPEEVPNMSHFKESQGIPENMDQIWTMHNPNRHNSPYVNNEYVPETFKMRVEQRFDVSGSVCEFKGDMRTCNFFDATKKDIENEKYKSFIND